MAERERPIPELAEFLRWLRESPEALFGEQAAGLRRSFDPRAMMSDLFETYTGAPLAPSQAAAFSGAEGSNRERNWLRWTAAAARLLWHESLRGRAVEAARLRKFFLQETADLAAVADASGLLDQQERQEELVRRLLRLLHLRLPGESAETAADRLRQVDSVEQAKLIAAAAQREARSQAVRKAMMDKAAEEAAARIVRE